jgi:hypothetical protein
LVGIIGKLSDILQKDLTSSCLWRGPGALKFTSYRGFCKNFFKQLPPHQRGIALERTGKEVANAAFLPITIKR